MTFNFPASLKRRTRALRVILAVAACAALAPSQAANSTNYKFDLLGSVGGATVAVSQNHSLVATIDPTAGRATSANNIAEIGVVAGLSVDSATGPQVLDVAPGTASCNGGDLIRIRGLNFNEGGASATVMVQIGSAPPFHPTVASNTELLAYTPPGIAGPATVTVTTAFGSAGLPGAFAYFCPSGPPVAMFTIFPVTGDVDGGTPVTITGLSLVSGTLVTFDGIPATDILHVNDQTLTCRTPMHTYGYATPIVQNILGGASLGGAFQYRAHAKVTNLGGGCGGNLGLPQNFIGGALPIIGGSQFSSVLANVHPNGVATLLLSDEQPQYNLGGCIGYINPLSFIALNSNVSPFGTTFMYFQLPNVPALEGVTVVSQWLIVDESAGAGFAVSNCLRIRLGI